MLLKIHHQHQSIDSNSFQNTAFFDNRLKREDLSETTAIETKSSLNRKVPRLKILNEAKGGAPFFTYEAEANLKNAGETQRNIRTEISSIFSSSVFRLLDDSACRTNDMFRKENILNETIENSSDVKLHNLYIQKDGIFLYVS
ncbi:hypothetical protein CEXT_422441 [Caerostris extrusa]|uniref:Uncharacterized protein n=1 Tax=Caerostris extrusa TaxID=172846 RepID=A0AAV4R2Y5_CAEEX|nr:hypothetical protein CEXT_422441 [Caerostris extrusa]